MQDVNKNKKQKKKVWLQATITETRDAGVGALRSALDGEVKVV